MKHLITYSLLVLIILSCKKSGCMDSLSDNYDSKAKKDDKSCIYTGSTVFWFNNTTAVFLQSSGVTYVEVYVEGKLVGGMATSSSYGTAPSCFEGGITFETELGTSNSKAFSFEIKNSSSAPNGPNIYSGTFKVDGGKCNSFQIQ
jgi:hypothetical protein